MPESLRDILADIRRKLKEGAYKNEEHVRLSLVARVLQALGWDIWNPAEVNAEFAATPAEDRTKVDIALFARDGYPAVLIEIKAVGKLEGNLDAIEMQVRDYNRDITAPFSVITDGQKWLFYYVKGEGTFHQKLFDRLDLTDSNYFITAGRLELYLSKGEIRNGNAEEEAKKKLNVTQKQEAMANAYSEAEAMAKREPFPSLADALVDVMKRKGFDITREEAIKYINTRTIEQSETQPTIPTEDKSTKGSKAPRKKQKKPKTISIGNDLQKEINSSKYILFVTAEWLISKGRLTTRDPILSINRWRNKLSYDINSFPETRKPYMRRLSNGIYIYHNTTVSLKVK